MTGQKIIDHAAYQKRIQKLPAIALRHIRMDAQEAIVAMPDGPNAGYYQDEVHYCDMELEKRASLGASRGEKYVKVLAEMYLILKEAGYNSYEMIDDLRDLVNDSRRPATEAEEQSYSDLDNPDAHKVAGGSDICDSDFLEDDPRTGGLTATTL